MGGWLRALYNPQNGNEYNLSPFPSHTGKTVTAGVHTSEHTCPLALATDKMLPSLHRSITNPSLPAGWSTQMPNTRMTCRWGFFCDKTQQ